MESNQAYDHKSVEARMRADWKNILVMTTDKKKPFKDLEANGKATPSGSNGQATSADGASMPSSSDGQGTSADGASPAPLRSGFMANLGSLSSLFCAP